ncbi:MAG: hypothetical protein R6V67_04315 [Spirochaetia bacterium]
MPLFLLGPEYTRTFWSSSWYLPLIFFAVIALIDGYFIAHWRLLSLLEEENWAGLIKYLEDQCIRRSRLRTQFVRTLINAYFITGNVSSIEDLEEVVRKKKPKLLYKFALQFGVPKMLHQNPDDIVTFFQEFKDRRHPKRLWIKFLYAFGLLMKRENIEGREVLLETAKEAKSPILSLVVLYTLEPFRTIDDEVLTLVDKKKSELSSLYSRDRMEKEITKERENVVVVILSKLISDALDWLYGTEEGTNGREDVTDEKSEGQSFTQKRDTQKREETT